MNYFALQNSSPSLLDDHRGNFVKYWVQRFLVRFSIPRQKIVSYTNIYRNYWDRYILFLAILNSISVPVQLSFEPPALRSLQYVLWDSFVDLFFLLDVVLKFMTTYQSKNGKEVFDPTLIAMRYIFSIGFVLDILSMFGNTLLTKLFPSLKIMRFLKMTRIFRLNSFIKRANIGTQEKAILNMLKLFFQLFLILHCFACLWYKAIMFEHEYLHEEHPLQNSDGSAYDEESVWIAPLFWLNYLD